MDTHRPIKVHTERLPISHSACMRMYVQVYVYEWIGKEQKIAWIGSTVRCAHNFRFPCNTCNVITSHCWHSGNSGTRNALSPLPFYDPHSLSVSLSLSLFLRPIIRPIGSILSVQLNLSFKVELKESKRSAEWQRRMSGSVRATGQMLTKSHERNLQQWKRSLRKSVAKRSAMVVLRYRLRVTLNYGHLYV